MIKAKDAINEARRMMGTPYDTKIDELTREVREHNNFAMRVHVLE